MNSHKILHYSPYEIDEKGNGGDKRTHQIICLIKELGYHVDHIDIDFQVPRKLNKVIFYFFWGVIYYLKLPLPSIPNIKGFIKIGYYASLCSKIDLRSYNKIVIEDFTFFGGILSFISKKKGLKVIGVVHNIDSLVPGRKSNYTGKDKFCFFFDEIRFQQNCEFLITISKEENWLLNLLGIDSVYLPYLPSKNVIFDLNKIKENRKRKQEFGNSLILGSVLNRPTMIGVKKLIDIFEKSETPADVVGYHTESLNKEFSNLEYVKIHGSVTNESLNEFLTECENMIVYQPFTSGVLTRVIEALLAGIPVFGNESAIRSYYYLDGVYKFNRARDNSRESSLNPNLTEYYEEVEDSKLLLKSKLSGL